MLRILNITSPDINNGNGVRATLWVAGCSHHCDGCQNKWTWNHNQGREFGEWVFSELKEALDKEYISGLTLSGGDPLTQDIDALKSLTEIIAWFREKYPTKNIWLYTGYNIDYFNVINPEKNQDNEVYKTCINILKSVDVVVDGPFVKEQKDLTIGFRGSRNQRIIDTRKYFACCSDFLLNNIYDK